MKEKLLNVMVVDDEALCLRGVTNSIDWEKYGFHVACDARDGQLALNHLEQSGQNIDLLLTDACMPFMNGIQLIERIKEKEMDIGIIIMSAYDEFEYAQEAIRFGVNAYLLKPITEEALSPYLLKIREEKSLQEKNSKKIESIKRIMLGCDQLSDENSDLLNKAKCYMEKNIANSKLSLKEVSHYVGMSKNYFCTVFKKSQGISFLKYLNNLRIIKSIELLSTTNKRIYEIAEQVGYSDPTWFSTAFKAATGKSPSYFRTEDCNEKN